ncbi:NAD-dependent epimerase/dehydratase family protein [Pseudonocardia acaciae]|uniref:NAD-dependent epimerase/dehydratase family protein n=1 Tax=Pseudonocardia acaciae TaxID=551276 RepID=UPI0012EE7A5E|nr:NAD-dependent epimerase/dehydratase family protein [Pseudonocardia acaciae]
MRVLVVGGTWFVGRRMVERLHERGDQVLAVHRGRSTPDDWVPVRHLITDRARLANHAGEIADFAPDSVVDTAPLTGAQVDAVTPALPEVPTVALSSQDVYAAFTGLRTGRELSPLPITEDSEVRAERYPYRGAGISTPKLDIPDDYEKLDVEERWLARGAVVLRLPVVYGPHDWQRREEPLLRRVRAGRRRIPVGAANLLWTRGYVDDMASGVLAALDSRVADGQAVNLGEARTWSVRTWFEQILRAAGSDAELVTVPDRALPADLALSATPAQHLLVSSARARRLLGWRPGDPAERVAESVRWHLAHPPPEPTWTDVDAAADDDALAQVGQ